MHYVYILRWKNSKLYIGYSKDLQRRMKEHQNEMSCTLLYYEAYKLSEAAREREEKLKQYGSAWRGLKKRIKD